MMGGAMAHEVSNFLKTGPEFFIKEDLVEIKNRRTKESMKVKVEVSVSHIAGNKC